MSIVCITGARGSTKDFCFGKYRREEEWRRGLYGARHVLSSTTQFKTRHEMFVTEKHVGTMKSNTLKTLLLKRVFNERGRMH